MKEGYSDTETVLNENHGFEAPRRLIVDKTKIAAAKQYARENDQFNITQPTPNQEYLVLVEGIDQVQVRGRESFIGRMRNLETGEVVKFWISNWLVQELYEKKVVGMNKPMLLTYQGRKASKKSSGSFNAWSRTYFTTEEAVNLGLIPHEAAPESHQN